MKIKSFNGYCRNRAKVLVTLNLSDPNLKSQDHGGIMNSCIVQGLGYPCGTKSGSLFTCDHCSFNLDYLLTKLIHERD